MLTREQKPAIVNELTELINTSRTIGIVKLHRLPAATLQTIKTKLSNIATIRVSRMSILMRALDMSSKPLAELKATATGPCGLICASVTPFELFKAIKASRGMAPAKVGMTAPTDIVIPAGPTALTPGPAISTLQKVGLKCRVEGGKIVILEPKKVCAAGELVTEEVVAVLALLKIAPIEIGLDIAALWEDGLLYTPEVLDIDTQAALVAGARAAIELCCTAEIYETIAMPKLITRAAAAAVYFNNLIKQIEVGKMNYIYAALLLHSASKPINEENLRAVCSAAGEADPARIKALVAALEGVDIDAALAQATVIPTAPPAPEKKEEKEEEKKKAEEAVEGLSALFG